MCVSGPEGDFAGVTEISAAVAPCWGFCWFWPLPTQTICSGLATFGSVFT
ncbi:Uncharacterised protein [Mycobacteroides abscessus subsp. abscessus]|nr:Uncharacterised protein [Mycobacteroides abscessus subsp. abscessus]